MFLSGASLLTSVVILAGIAQGAVKYAKVASDAQCNCFMANGSTSEYYMNHTFFDFRNLTQYAGVPTIIENSTESSTVNASSDYFNSEQWNSIWATQKWNNSDKNDELEGSASVLVVKSPNNVYIESNDADNSSTYLTMRTKRLADFQTCAEVQTATSDYHYVSVRMLARTTGAAGGCAALFTYLDHGDSSNTTVQEADIEMLTRGPRDKIQYTNQPGDTDVTAGGEASTQNVTIPDGLTFGDWLVHRLDWTPDASIWYVNGQEVARIAVQTPKDPSYVLFNSWSNGATWTGNMTVGDEAVMQIQWLEMIYNTSTSANVTTKRGLDISDVGPDGQLVRRDSDSEVCQVVCSIDDTTELGSAVLLWNGTNAAARFMAETGMGGNLVWLSTWVVGIVALLYFV